MAPYERPREPINMTSLMEFSSTTTVTQTREYCRFHEYARYLRCDRHCNAPRCLEERMQFHMRCGCFECGIRYRQVRHEIERQRSDPYYQRREQIGYWNEPVIKQLTSGDDMNLVEKVKNLKLSAADKLLRKHGVVDAEGDLTETGQDLVWAKLLDAYKDEIVTDLKAIDKEAKTSK